MSDRILEALQKVRVVRVDAVLTLRHVQAWRELRPDFVRENCLWPRVTLQAGDRRKVIPFTEIAKPEKSKLEPGEMNIWEAAIIGFCGGNRKSELRGARRQAMDLVVSDVRSKVSKALSRAAQTKKVQERVRQEWIRVSKKAFKEAFIKWFEGSSNAVGGQHIQPHELAAILREHRKLQVVRHVLET